MTYKVGSTFWVPSGPDGKSHLYVILTEADQKSSYLWVSITSIRQGKFYDDTCLFKGGEHTRLTHPSYVYYREATTIRDEHITKMINLKYYTLVEDMNDQEVVRMLKGVRKSEQVKPFIVDYLDDYEARKLLSTQDDAEDNAPDDD